MNHEVYCKTCGLPKLEIPDEEDENTGTYLCVYCEWTSDEMINLIQENTRLKNKIAKVMDALIDE